MCDSCKRMREYAATTTIPAADWRVTAVEDCGAGEFYRYAVEGENLNHAPTDVDRRFHWRVPDIHDPRYDLTAVEVRCGCRACAPPSRSASSAAASWSRSGGRTLLASQGRTRWRG